MYLDPGFGGMLLQVIVLIAATGGAILFSLRKKISALFKGSKKASTLNPPASKSKQTSDDDVIDTLSEED